MQKRGGGSLHHRVSGLVQRKVDVKSASEKLLGLSNNLTRVAILLNSWFIDLKASFEKRVGKGRSEAAGQGRAQPGGANP